MTLITSYIKKTECKFHLSGNCRNSQCSFSHYEKILATITFEDRDRKYLLGRTNKGEVYITGHLMNEFYRNSNALMLENNLNRIFEITIHPDHPKPSHNRLVASTVIERLEDYDMSINTERAPASLRESFEQHKKDVRKNYENLQLLLSAYKVDAKKNAEDLKACRQSFSEHKSITDKKFDDLHDIIKNFENQIKNQGPFLRPQKRVRY